MQYASLKSSFGCGSCAVLAGSLARPFTGNQKLVQQQCRSPECNGGVGYVEYPRETDIPAADIEAEPRPGEVDEVDHRPESRPVDEIAYGPAHNHRESGGRERTLGAEHPQREADSDGADD